PGDGPVAVGGPVPASDDDGGGDAHPQQHVLLGCQALEGGGAHRGEHRRPQLAGEHPRAEPAAGCADGDGAERHERLLAGGLRGPERAEAGVGGIPRDLDRRGGSERLEAGEGDPRCCSCHPGDGSGCRRSRRARPVENRDDSDGSDLYSGTSPDPRVAAAGGTMTEVLDNEVLDTQAKADSSIREALDLIEKGLGEMSDRQIVPTSEVADLLLDVRSVLAKLDAEVSTN